MTNIKNKLANILKANQWLLTIFTNTGSLVLRAWGRFLRLKDKQLLITANSMGYNDSPRAIFEELAKREKYKELEIVWALNNKADLPAEYRDQVKVIKPDTIEYFKTALQSKYWLSSVNIERGLHFKKKETIFLNTWHGIPIKTVGNAAPNRNDFNWSETNFICFSNQKEKEIYIRDFQAKESSMVPCGLPRNDELYDVSQSRVETLKIKLNIPKSKKVILYAPTWRENEGIGNHDKINIPINWNLWQRELSGDYVILLRAHPYTTKLMGVKFNDFVRDFGSYKSINNLLMVSDLLISDYSSIIFDYAIMEKPIICFAYDYEDYRNNRGIYMDLKKEMPGGILKNESEVLYKIKKMDYKKEADATKRLKEKSVVYGGQATDMCIDLLFGGFKDE